MLLRGAEEKDESQTGAAASSKPRPPAGERCQALGARRFPFRAGHRPAEVAAERTYSSARQARVFCIARHLRAASLLNFAAFTFLVRGSPTSIQGGPTVPQLQPRGRPPGRGLTPRSQTLEPAPLANTFGLLRAFQCSSVRSLRASPRPGCSRTRCRRPAASRTGLPISTRTSAAPSELHRASIDALSASSPPGSSDLPAGPRTQNLECNVGALAPVGIGI